VAKKKWPKLPDFGHFFIGEIARNYPEKKWPKIGFAASKPSSSKQHKKKATPTFKNIGLSPSLLTLREEDAFWCNNKSVCFVARQRRGIIRVFVWKGLLAKREESI